ncbi:MAG: ABC transporter ATP-binding protein/permease [Clostridiales bacterium]|nr:ABC transporter ATP-binding protein/permease [Clostridiales bacterium]
MLQVQNIHKEYRTGNLVQKALDDVSLNLRDNEFVAILGPSGSGKTTLLNIIGGLDQYDSGDLIINGISTKKYKDRDWDSYRNHTIGFVFQSYNLIPHQTLLSNVELALTISGVGKGERRRRAKAALEQVGLGEQINKRPNQLSGGQMQRVAIARALVNDPDILLADEPTGALDSTTSVQVMDLLGEVAKDRLVVMVTHNPELARQYATRIVELRDGKICSDTDPYIVNTDSGKPPEHRNMGKSYMHFWTSVALSFNNLRTKKARTLLTAFAGSIGIIGIALILALSTGVNDYIASIEEDTLTGYPLQISSTGFDLTSLFVGTGSASGDEEEEDSGVINVSAMITTMFSRMDSNDLAALKDYLDSGESGIEPYVRAVEYSYDVVTQIYSQSDNDIRQVNPDSSFSSLGFGSWSSASSLMSSMMSTDVFYQLPETEELYEDQYQLMAGHWPENYDELVLVLNSDGSISDFLLYTLGLRDAVELDEMVRQFADGEDVETPENIGTYTYEDVMGTTFRLVNAADYYEYDDEYGVWTDKSGNTEYMEELVEEGEELSIVGIVQAEKENSGILSSGIYYLSSLPVHVAEVAAESESVQEQLADPDTNIFTGEAFGETSEESSFDMESLVSIDEDALAEAFSFDTDSLSTAFSGSSLDLSDALSMDFDMRSLDLSSLLDFSSLTLELPDLPEMDLSGLLEGVTIDLSSLDLSAVASGLMTGYEEYLKGNFGTDYTSLEDAFFSYLSSASAQEILRADIMEIWAAGEGITVSTEQLDALVADILNSYLAYIEANGGNTGGNASGSDASLDYVSFLQSYLGTSEAQNLIQNWIARNVSVNEVTVTQEQLQKVLSDLVEGYNKYAEENEGLGTSDLAETFMAYLETDSASEILTQTVMSALDTDAIATQISGQIGTMLEEYMTSAMASYGETLSSTLESQMTSAMTQIMSQVMSQLTTGLSSSIESAMTEMVSSLSVSLEDAMGIDADSFMEAFTFNMDSDDLTELLVSMSSAVSSTYEGNLENLGYSDFSTPSEIDIYSADFESKDQVTEILDAYNASMEEEGNEAQVITYTDTVGTLMSSVTEIINLISYVLIAFVAISLVVSSIMIGVITYISVLERKKEIGILRAIGASKGNISQVFNAETGIIGLFAGLLGIGLALLLMIPGNALIHYFAESDEINMVLLPRYGIALVLLSVFLTLLGGLIPSRTAAKSDPVTALRTE